MVEIGVAPVDAPACAGDGERGERKGVHEEGVVQEREEEEDEGAGRGDG